MNKLFGSIPEEILAIELLEFESQYKTLAHMIADTTDEEIVEANYAISYSKEDKAEIRAFTAWTENYVLKLKETQLGFFMLKFNRSSSKMDN